MNERLVEILANIVGAGVGLLFLLGVYVLFDLVF